MQVFHGDRLAGRYGGAPAEARRHRDLGVALVDERIADQVVEGSVEVAAAIEQRLRRGELASKLVGIGRTHLVDQCGRLGVGGNHV